MWPGRIEFGRGTYRPVGTRVCAEKMLERVEPTREKILEVAEALVYEKGFSGTSLNDIVRAANLTKGAFFHHFSGKDELAGALLERYARNDFEVLNAVADRAKALADDPLQEAILNLKLFEEWLEGLEAPLAGCMYASFTSQRDQFDAATRRFISDKLNEWAAIYEDVFERVIAVREPKIEGVTARALAELVVSVIEGGLLVGRATNDPHLLVRQCQQARNYIRLLFAD